MARTTRSAPGSAGAPRGGTNTGARRGSTHAGARGGGTSASPPAPKRRNPNRWRFYVLLVLLGLIVATVLWFTVGRDAWASFLDDRADVEPEQSEPSGDDQGSQDADTDPEDTDPEDTDPEDADPADPDPEGADPEGDGEADDPAAGQDPGSGAADDPAGMGTEPDEEALANPVECRAEALRVQVDTEGRAHGTGQEVPIAVQVTNTGAVPCLVDLGHESMQVEITSGSDDIWGTAQCPRGDGERRLLLDVDAEVSHTVTWPGQRCASGDVAGQGTYHIDVAVPATPAAAGADAVIELD